MPADRRFQLSVSSGLGGVLAVVVATAVVAVAGLVLAAVMALLVSGGS